MKISLWSSFFVEDEPEVALTKLTSCGYRYTELSVEHSASLLKRPGTIAATAAAFSRYAADHDIGIPQAHLAFAVNPVAEDEKQRTAALDSLKQQIEFYIQLGVKVAVLHVCAAAARKAGWAEEKIDEVRTASLQTLCAVSAGSGMRLALENLRTDLFDAQELLRVIARSGCRDDLGICLDTGHLNVAGGGDQVGFVREAGDLLIALHITDNRGKNDDHLFPFGGTIEWFPLLEALRSSRYTGLFNLESPGERIFEPMFPQKNAILLHKARYGCDLAQLMLDVG